MIFDSKMGQPKMVGWSNYRWGNRYLILNNKAALDAHKRMRVGLRVLYATNNRVRIIQSVNHNPALVIRAGRYLYLLTPQCLLIAL